ncbi:MAG: sugar transferase [Longimicrobiales bacterium]
MLTLTEHARQQAEIAGGEMLLPSHLLYTPELRLHVFDAAAAPHATKQDEVRRWLNMLAAAIGLIVLAPVMFLVALLVKLTSAGPILYTQTRVGIDRRHPGSGGNWRRQVDYGGQLFKMYKFRTMYVGSDRDAEVWACPEDPRVTPVGRFLRRSRLDELPQLWNVLRGDMNIVGPRPEQPRIFAHLRGELQGYARRQRVLPGITGLAQVEWRYDQCIDDVRRKLNYDLRYLESRSALEDVRIMLRTVPVVMFGQGAW